MNPYHSTENQGTPEHRPRLVIAGAGGSIGTAVCRKLASDYEIIALTRSEARSKLQDPDMPVTWKFCDFFSMGSVEKALAGADYAIYLIHTRLPTARLDQAESEDMDLLLADNFARAASKNNVKQILYLGSLIPEGEITSPLMHSRYEIAEVLSSHGTPVTTLRASLIVGPGSSIVNLLANMVRRAPFVLIPRWALTRRQPIALTDVLRAMRFCLGNRETFSKDYDIGGETILNFKEIMEDAAKALEKKRIILTIPYMPARLYYWWIRLLDRSTHPGLVRIIVESLQHDVVVTNNPLQDIIVKDAMPARKALDPYLEQEDKDLPPNPRSAFQSYEDTDLIMQSRVRSIQRLRRPQGRNAEWVADYYFQWLPRFLRPFILCEIDQEGSCNIYVRLLRLRILELTLKPEKSTLYRRMYFITGGVLARVFGSRNSRLEFRDIPAHPSTIVAIHDFRPFLPWYFYVATQAVVHKFVMRAYQKQLERLADNQI
jgi:uncharacterized protein YbjT (DUF2867 family)